MAAVVNAPIRNDVIDVSRPASHAPLWRFLLNWIEAGALVIGGVLTLIAVGIPLVLVVTWMVDLLRSLVSRVW
jgi:hypothetical protein